MIAVLLRFEFGLENPLLAVPEARWLYQFSAPKNKNKIKIRAAITNEHGDGVSCWHFIPLFKEFGSQWLLENKQDTLQWACVATVQKTREGIRLCHVAAVHLGYK